MSQLRVDLKRVIFSQIFGAHVILGAALGAALCLTFIGCGGDQKAAVNKTAPTTAILNAPLQPLNDDDYKTKSSEELMRYHVSALNLLNPPAASTQGCVTFSKGTGTNFLNAKYNCSWSDTSNEAIPSTLNWGLTNTEKFTNDPSDSSFPLSSIASFKFSAVRPGQVQKVALATTYVRTLRIGQDPKQANQFKVLGSTSLGFKTDTRHQNWQTALNGSWIVDPAKNLVLAEASTLTFTHNNPSAKGHKADVTALIYTVGSGGLKFDTTSSCARPVGALSWTKTFNNTPPATGTASGTVYLTNKGIEDETKLIAWPASCLEFHGAKLH